MSFTLKATHHNDRQLDQRLSGAFIDLQTLIDARFFAADLNLQQRRKSLSLLAGPNKTNFRGRGIDFEEVRAYQPGDDIRTIDWRVTARTGKAYTKLFQEERERPLLVMTDQRQSMFFGSQHCFKSVTACYLSALIAWSGLHNSDRVGGLVFGNNGQQEIKPRRGKKSALALMHLLLEYNQKLSQKTMLQKSAAAHMEQSLIELRRIAKPGSAVYIISDFAGFDDSIDHPGEKQHSENAKKHLHLLSRHCEITALYISDPLEKLLPPPGQYTVTDGTARNAIYTGDQNLRHRYSEHFSNKLLRLNQQLNKLGIPLIEVGTEQAPLARLLHYYGNKSSISGGPKR